MRWASTFSRSIFYFSSTILLYNPGKVFRVNRARVGVWQPYLVWRKLLGQLTRGWRLCDCAELNFRDFPATVVRLFRNCGFLSSIIRVEKKSNLSLGWENRQNVARVQLGNCFVKCWKLEKWVIFTYLKISEWGKCSPELCSVSVAVVSHL